MKKKELDIDEDIQHEKLKWKIERISWIILLVILLLALAGGLGAGPVSSRIIETRSFSLKYLFINRYSAPAELKIHTKFIPREDFTIWIKDSFIKEAAELSVNPNPKSYYVQNGNAIFVFEENDNNNDPVAITFQFNHQRIGITNLRAGIRKDYIETTQIVLP